MLLSIDNDLIKASAFDISLFLPKIGEIPELTPTETLMRVPASGLSSESNQFLYHTPSQGKIVERPHDLREPLSFNEIHVTCQWNSFTRKGAILGYHYEVIKVVEENIARERETPAITAKEPRVEFAYDMRANAFYQSAEVSQTPPCCLRELFPYGRERRCSLLPESVDSGKAQQPRQLPGFISPIYPQLKKMCEQTGDYALMGKVPIYSVMTVKCR